MKNNIRSGLLTKNSLKHILEEDYLQHNDYIEIVKSFARLTYESIYVIDYEKMAFEYVSENPIFLCGYSPEEVQSLGYEFYFKNVPENDLEMLSEINEAGFNFFERLPHDDRKSYSITYDFHLINKDGKKVLINHKLTPLFLTSEGRIWKAMCIVSISNHKEAGNIFIIKQGSDEVWELSIKSKAWLKQTKPQLTRREIEVLRLHAQGLTINEIAEKVCVSPDTVKYYRRKIFEQLKVKNVTEALSYAVRYKII